MLGSDGDTSARFRSQYPIAESVGMVVTQLTIGVLPAANLTAIVSTQV